MQTGYSRSPRLLKGALIQFKAPMLIPIPNIIVFQYNPETMTRTLTSWSPLERERTYNEQGRVTETAALTAAQENQLRQPFDPAETFSLVLELDAADALEEPSSHPIATIAGVADRISAMELLCYPPGPGAIGGLLNVSVNVSLGGGGPLLSVGTADQVPRRDVPIVLFFWGPGRIIPVRITSFAVEEQQYSPLLYPIRAKVNIGLRVLDANHLENIAGDTSQTAIVEIAKACYKLTQAQKEALALANIANSVESIIGMLPI